MDFSVRAAVKILSGSFPRGNHLSATQKQLLKVWAFTGLIAWMALHQQPNTNKKKGGKNEVARNKARKKNAERAQLIVMYNLAIRPTAIQLNAENRKALSVLIKLAGGLSAVTEGRSGRSLIAAFHRQHVAFRHVAEMVDYMVRYGAYPDDRNRGFIEDAKDFAVAKMQSRLTPRVMGKYWEQNRPAAAYLFALSSWGMFREKNITLEDALNWFVMFVQKEQRVRRLLQRAAHATTILGGVVDKPRHRDFTGIELPPIKVKPFSQAELSLVKIATRKAPIA